METDLDAPEAPRRPAPPRGLLWAAALAAVVLAIATLVAFRSSDETDGPTRFDPGATGGAPAPGLVAPDRTGVPVGGVTYETFAGETATLGDLTGRPLVVNFFASWCVPCIDEMPEFEAVHRRYAGTVGFLGLSVTDEAATALALVERTGVTYEVGRDPTGSVLEELGGIGMPTTVIVAADGTIAAVHTGRLREVELEALVAAQLR